MDPAGVVLAGREQGQAVVVVMLVVPGKKCFQIRLGVQQRPEGLPKNR
jgi:hypothetical protein